MGVLYYEPVVVGEVLYKAEDLSFFKSIQNDLVVGLGAQV